MLTYLILDKVNWVRGFQKEKQENKAMVMWDKNRGIFKRATMELTSVSFRFPSAEWETDLLLKRLKEETQIML